MSFYISEKFQCKDTWELIDSNNCTRPLAELVKWSDGWTLETFVKLSPEARLTVSKFLSSYWRSDFELDFYVTNFGLHIMKKQEPKPKPEPESELPVWLL